MSEMETEFLVVVDCQVDFIRGSLACLEAEEAVDRIVDYINSKDDLQVMYSMDWHSPENGSFLENGGIWPPHCVQGTPGAELDRRFYDCLGEGKHRPGSSNMFRKGTDDLVEEYSAAGAVNEDGVRLDRVPGDRVTVCGIASEYCVRETVLSFLELGKEVTLVTGGLGFVEKEGHSKNLKDLADRGVLLVP